MMNDRQTLKKLVGFVLKSRARLMLQGPGSDLRNAGRIIMLFGVLVYAGLYGIVYFIVEPEIKLLLLNVMLASLAVMLLTGNNFPSVKMPTDLIPGYYPVSPLNRLLVNLLFDLFRPSFIYVLIFLMIAGSITGAEGLRILPEGVMLIIGLISVDYALKMLVTRQNKYLFRNSILAACCIFLLISYFMLIFSGSAYPFWASSLLLFFWMLASLFCYYEIMTTSGDIRVETVTGTGTGIVGIGQVWRLLYNRRTTTWPTYFFILVFKLMLGLYIYFYTGRISDAVMDVYILFIAMPIIPFSHVHNNLFGFDRSLWLEFQLRNGRFKDLLRAYTGSLLYPLLSDLAFTLIILALTGLLSPALLLIYALCTLVMIPAGIWASYRFSRKVESLQLSSFRNNTSGLFSFLSVSGLIVIAVITNWFAPAGVILALMIAVLASFKARQYHYFKKHLVYNNLFRAD